MMLQSLLLVLIVCMTGCLSLIIQPPNYNLPFTRNPCSATSCGLGTECRLQDVRCIRAPCLPQATCKPIRRTIVSCPIEKPVLSMNGRDIMCRRDSNCPDGTFCKSNGYRGGCCLRQSGNIIEKPGFCQRPRFGQVGICVEECSYDGQCPGSQKCCSNGCGRTCQNVIGTQIDVKPGNCPFQGIDFRTSSINNLRCGRPCSSDVECPGSWKCCNSGGCGRICRRPENGPSLCPIWNPRCRFTQ